MLGGRRIPTHSKAANVWSTRPPARGCATRQPRVTRGLSHQPNYLDYVVFPDQDQASSAGGPVLARRLWWRRNSACPRHPAEGPWKFPFNCPVCGPTLATSAFAWQSADPGA